MGDVPNVPELDNFSKRQRVFIEWLATSKYKRKPPNQEMLADELGLNRKTLSRWKKLPGLLDAATAVARKMVHDQLPEVYAALTREATAGSYQHIKLLLELCGEHEDSSKVDVTTKGESLNERRHSEHDITESLAGLYGAFTSGLLPVNSRGNGSVDTEKQAAVGGTTPSSA